MKANYKIGYLSSADPRDKRTWSGTYYNMLNALQNDFSEVEVLGPVPLKKHIKVIIRLLHYVHRIIFLKRYNNDHNIILSYFYSKKFKKLIKDKKIDILFAPAASAEIALLKTDIPICYLSDSSFGQMRNYYDYFKSISYLSCKESNYIENKAINKSSIVIYPSKWAADFVIDYYKADSEKVHVVKFGPNFIQSQNSKTADLIHDETRLLFVGVEWQRKGGDIVKETFDILLSEGFNVKLIVVGTVPPIEHPNIEVYKFLDKNNEKDVKVLTDLYLNSTLLFVPTRAECYGIVFCEAASFGLPSITTDTGGVTAIIEDGYNGYALPVEADAVKYAKKIKYLINNPGELTKFGKNAKQKYEEELNWPAWGKKMKKIIVDFLDHG